MLPFLLGAKATIYAERDVPVLVIIIAIIASIVLIALLLLLIWKIIVTIYVSILN